MDILEDGSKIYNLYPKEVDENCNCIFFYTDNQEVYVYGDDKLIYSRENYNTIFGHATGRMLNVVEFDTSEIKIKLHPSYETNSQASCRFYIGNGMDLLVRNIKATAGEVIICILLLTAGIYLVLYYLRTRKGAGCSREVINLGIIAILLGVAIFLISNTVTVGISVRKEEIAIMKLIGATDFLVRAPFLVEGILIGLIGAALPLILLHVLYNNVCEYIVEKFNFIGTMLTFVPAGTIFQMLVPIALILGVGIGFLGSRFTIHKHLKV